MKKRSYVLVFLFLLTVCNIASASVKTLSYGHFGKITLYSNVSHPTSVVLFVSGDGGWNLGVVDMARQLAKLDALVVGINVVHYLRALDAAPEKCSYPAGDFEMLSHYVQKKLNFPEYLRPILIGYSSGATLVYAVLVQAPANTFRGAVSMGFSPDLPIKKPFCEGSGLNCQIEPQNKGYIFLPAAHLQNPWIALQGTIDQVCSPAETEAFVKQVKGAKIIVLPKVGHGYSVPRNWLPQFKKVFFSLSRQPEPDRAATPESLNDLPLVTIPAKNPAADTMAVIITGDGGWAGLDRDIGRMLADKGISVVGLSSLKYFWQAKTPDRAGHDLARILTGYLARLKKKRVILIGYSMGADVLPFMVNRLPGDLQSRIGLVALLSPGNAADFEFHITSWLPGTADGKSALPVLPEIKKLAGTRHIPVLCFCGDAESNRLCARLNRTPVRVIPLAGGHHLGGKYGIIVDTILRDTPS